MVTAKKFRDTRTGEIVTQVPITEIRFFEEVKARDLQAELLQAKQDGNKAKTNEIITEMLRPEAKSLMALAGKDITSKDGYGSVLQFLPSVSPFMEQFLDALELEGYPLGTIEILKELI